MTQTKKIKDALDEALLNNDTVFIVPHHKPRADFDAFGAAMGISLICKKNKKKSFIIIDEDYNKFDIESRKVLDSLEKNFNVIRAKDAFELMNGRNLMIAVDVNKDYLISDDARCLLPNFNDIFILDHHKPDEHTIKAKYLFANDKISSTCEEVSRLLFLYGVKLTPEFANYLYAGIALDTNKLTKNATADTFSVVSKLIVRGADPTTVYNMFSEDYESDRKMLRIVNNAVFPTHIYAIAADEDVSKIHDAEDIAKAADYLLKYKINASFALGYIDENTVSISARSKGGIDVSSIMKLFGGGGNEFSAAARIVDCPLETIKSHLEFLLDPASYIQTTNVSLDDSVMKLKLTR